MSEKNEKNEKAKPQPPARAADHEGAQPPDWRKNLVLREFRKSDNLANGNPDGIPEGEWTS